MIVLCEYCRGPISGNGLCGRPHDDHPPARYCCYGCLSLGEDQRAAPHQNQRRWKIDGFALRMGICILVAGQSMIFGLAISLEEQTPPTIKQIVQGTILGSTLLSVLLLGWPLFRNTLRELRHCRLTIESLFVLTMLGAFAASMQSFLRGHGPIYFEVVTVLLIVYSLGKAIGARHRAAAFESTRHWAVRESLCRKLDDDRVTEVLITSLVPGDRVEVRSGEVVPIDGVVRHGVGFLSESVMTGEPGDVVRRPGDHVTAGTIVRDATFRIEATTTGTNRRLDRLFHDVEAARLRAASIEAKTDRVVKWFFVVVTTAALGTFWGWTLSAGWQVGLFRAMSVLLVACPCALGLATPIVIWATLHRLAECGLVVRSSDTLERLATVNRVVFDKTGTLTDERYGLVDVVTRADGEDRTEVLSWIRAVAGHASHPILKPLAGRGHTDDASNWQVEDVRVIAGSGIEAIVVGSTRHHLAIGQPEWIREKVTTPRPDLSDNACESDRRIDVAIDGEWGATARLRERLRDSAMQTIADCHALNLEVEVLSGDHQDRLKQLGLPQPRGGITPEGKADYLRSLVEHGEKPLMVGDGVNDMVALAVAPVGIALATGTDAANEAANAVLYHDDLRVIPWSIALARAAKAAIRRNVVRAAIYNLIGMGFAAAGMLHPILAVLLMVASSLLVTWSSVRIGTQPISVCEPAHRSRGSEPTTRWLAGKSIVHFLAMVGQGVILAWLFGWSGTPFAVVTLAAALVGILIAWCWVRWSTIPHAVDMILGMLTLGNLGMVFGWWVDQGFGPISGACCGGVREHPWMWVGMLFASNAAMLFLLRTPHPVRGSNVAAMFVGGNLGMAVGMWVGGLLASMLPLEETAISVLVHYFGMTLGMGGGMWLGYDLVRVWLTTRRI